VNIFTKRNALVGYLTLKAHARARRRFMRRQRRRSAFRILALIALGIVSVGVLVAFAGVLHRRQREELDAGDENAAGEVEAEAGGFEASAEPIPAT
jgi:hypothetical protein